jgi:hypothetical protein
VSGAVDTLDPVEAARADIAGSKHLIASVADDLSQHQEWLKNYRVAEKRHARWLQFQELKYQTELKRRATARTVKRFALGVALLVRSVWLSAVKWTTAFVAWLTPRAHALALTLGRWTAAGLAWTRATVVKIARALLNATLATFVWIATTSRAMALALANAASNAGAWIGAQLEALALALRRLLNRAWLQTLIFARASRRATSVALAWTAAQSAALAHVLRRLLYRGWLQTLVFARASRKATSIASAWIAVQSVALAHKLQRLLYRAWLEWRVFARASLKAASIAGIWAVVESAALAHKLQRLLYRAWVEWRVFARSAFNMASAESLQAAKRSRIFVRGAWRYAVAGSSSAWTKTGSVARASLNGIVFAAAKTERLFDKRIVPSPKPMQPGQATTAKTAINGQCTALVCIEPWRARLPALRESLAIPPLSWRLPPPPEAQPPA